jgi:hypothetical protein
MICVLAGESAAFIRLEADVLAVGGGTGGSRDNAHSLSHPRVEHLFVALIRSLRFSRSNLTRHCVTTARLRILLVKGSDENSAPNLCEPIHEVWIQTRVLQRAAST